MGVYLNPGTGKFERAIKSEIYVDKTGLIKETNKVLETEQCYICISRPRRFGKSMAANMLAAYYGKGYDSSFIFDRYEIADSDDYRKYQNHYNVIAVNMQNFLSKKENIKEMLAYLQKKVIAELQKLFVDFVSEEECLSEYLDEIYAETGEMFVIIIDEWDCLLREQKYNEDSQKTYLDFLRDLLKDKAYVALAYMTGILPIKKYGTHSALNIFTEYSMTNPDVFERFVGFTQTEVQDLCARYHKDYCEMKSWYDGYLFAGENHIYNPKSVVESIIRNAYASYWTRTETYEALKIYIEMNFDGLKDAIIRMLAGEKVKINTERFQNDMTTFKTKDDVLTLLVHLGYLAFQQETSQVYIPNAEIQGEFNNAIEGEHWADIVHLIEDSDRLLKATWDMDSNQVAEMIDSVHMENTSILTYNDENSLSCVISLAYYNAANYYTKVRELPTGKGFADIVYIPKKNVDKPAMIVELKYDKTAQGAIRQIKDRNYGKSLEEYAGNILLVGINYDKTSKKHECSIEEWQK